MSIAVKRVYEPPAKSDGYRVLVDRLWPRGLKKDDAPLDPDSDCPASRDYSRAYLHHLVRAEEILGQGLLSWHNIAFFQALMIRMRAAIRDGTFDALRRDLGARWRQR